MLTSCGEISENKLQTGTAIPNNIDKYSTVSRYTQDQISFTDTYNATYRKLIDQETAAEGNSLLFKEASDKISAYRKVKQHHDNWVGKIISLNKLGDGDYYLKCEGYKGDYGLTLPSFKFSEDEMRKLTPGMWITFSGDCDFTADYYNVTFSCINN